MYDPPYRHGLCQKTTARIPATAMKAGDGLPQHVDDRRLDAHGQGIPGEPADVDRFGADRCHGARRRKHQGTHIEVLLDNSRIARRRMPIQMQDARHTSERRNARLFHGFTERCGTQAGVPKLAMPARLEPALDLAMEHEEERSFNRVKDDGARGKVGGRRRSPDAVLVIGDVRQRRVAQPTLWLRGRFPRPQLGAGGRVKGHRKQSCHLDAARTAENCTS